MRLTCALLCDAATVRDGLLHILGGGVSVIGRPAIPAPMGVTVALMVEQHRTELDREHDLQVLVLSADGAELARADLKWRAELPPPGVVASGYPFPVVVPLQGVVLPQAGTYSVEIVIDDVHQVTLPLTLVNQPITPSTPPMRQAE